MRESYLKYIPEPLLDDIVGDCCIPIIGAGFSKNANVPSNLNMPLWNDLGKYFVDKLPGYPFLTPIDAISEFTYEFSRVKLIEELRKVLLINEAKPGSTHVSFANLQFDTIVTTNIDFLLEKAYDQIKRAYQVILNENQLSIRMGGANTVLLKIHGDLANPDRLIMTEDDYDMFLTKYPLISTFLSNLLITKTPLFIGYSLDDPDYRHLWNILGDRLGDLRRPGYTLLVNPSPFEISKYNRRGIKVIELPGKKEDYSMILSSLFQELYDYWDAGSIRYSIVTDDEVLSQLSLPKDSETRLCYFAIPIKLQAYYKKHIFSIAQRFGFTPITDMDISAPGDNVIPKLTLLNQRASIIIVDASEASSLSKLTSEFSEKKKILIINDTPIKSSTFDRDYEYLIRPIFPEPPNTEFNRALEKFFRQTSNEMESKLYDEPKQLLEKGEDEAAIIAAVSLLQFELKNILRIYFYHQKLEELNIPNENVLDIAKEYGIISHKEYQLANEWESIRNRLIHISGEEITHSNTEKIVSGITEILESVKIADMFLEFIILDSETGLELMNGELHDGALPEFDRALFSGFIIALMSLGKEIGMDITRFDFTAENYTMKLYEFDLLRLVLFINPRANIKLVEDRIIDYFSNMVEKNKSLLEITRNDTELARLRDLCEEIKRWLYTLNKFYQEKIR